MTAASPVLGLLQVVGGQEAIDYWYAAGGVETGYALGDALADVVEVGCLATDDGAEDDDSVVAVVECHLVGAVDELEGAGYGLHVDVLRQGPVLLEGAHAALQQCSGNLGIPLSHDDAENHVGGIGDFREVVVA